MKKTMDEDEDPRSREGSSDQAQEVGVSTRAEGHGRGSPEVGRSPAAAVGRSKEKREMGERVRRTRGTREPKKRPGRITGVRRGGDRRRKATPAAVDVGRASIADGEERERARRGSRGDGGSTGGQGSVRVTSGKLTSQTVGAGIAGEDGGDDRQPGLDGGTEEQGLRARPEDLGHGGANGGRGATRRGTAMLTRPSAERIVDRRSGYEAVSGPKPDTAATFVDRRIDGGARRREGRQRRALVWWSSRRGRSTPARSSSAAGRRRRRPRRLNFGARWRWRGTSIL